MQMRGVDVLIEVEGDTPDTFIVIGGQRGASLSESNETIDITSKDSGGAFEYDYGFYGWEISCDGLYIKNDEGYKALADAMKNKKKVRVRIKEEGTATLVGEALVTSKELDGPYDAEVTYSVTLQGSGRLEEVE